MNKSLSLSLKILAIFFWWYIVVFVFSVLPLIFPETKFLFVPEFRGEVYRWDFELMFTAIFAVWGWYLWKISEDPKKYRLFINFTIWATIAHIITMLVIGFLRPEDLTHMIKDAIALSIPIGLIIYVRDGTTKR